MYRYLPAIIAIVAGIGALVYISRPGVSMKLGSMLKCERYGNFIEGWYGGGWVGKVGEVGKPQYRIKICDAPPREFEVRKILEEKSFSDYASFRKAFDRACATGTIKEKAGK